MTAHNHRTGLKLDRVLLDKIESPGGFSMKARVMFISIAGLGLIMGFQNCGGPVGTAGETELLKPDASGGSSISGKFKIEKFVATSKCPDIDTEGGACAAVYVEDDALTEQSIEFHEDGTLIVEAACNTYYADYEFSSNGTLGKIAVGNLSGTSANCDGEAAEEESVLMHRLSKSVRIVEEGPKDLTLFTDQSSALKLRAL